MAFASTLAQLNAAATKEDGEPAHAGNAGGRSMWFTWTAPATGVATADTCDGDFDTVLGVYQGVSLVGLTEISSDDDTCVREGGSFAEFFAQAGQTYRIAVDGFDGDTGSFDLYVEGQEPPPPAGEGGGGTGTGGSTPPPPPPPPPPSLPAGPTGGDDRLIGTAGDDRICGLGGSDVIDGLGGNDTLFGDGCAVVTRASRRGQAAANAGSDTLRAGRETTSCMGQAVMTR